MRLYKVYNKHNIRNLFFNEKIIAPIYYDNMFYDYKLEEADENESFIILYSKIPKLLLTENSFVIELEIKLNKNNYVNDGVRYIIFNNIYLDDNNVILKKIYYPSEDAYRDLTTEVILIGEAKLYDKYKEKFNIIDTTKLNIISCNNFKSLIFRKNEVEKLVELEKKKMIEYDSLKGSLYLITKFYPKILVRDSREIKMSEKILDIRKLIKKIDEDINGLAYEKTQIKKLLVKSISSCRNEISMNILNNIKNKKQCIFTISNKNIININFDMSNNDQALVNKIINIILNIKKINVIENKNNLEEMIVNELGHYCKASGDNQLYNDARTLYSVLIKRNLNSNYKNIQNNIIKFLYLSLEYYNNINVLNAIVSDYKFTDYYIIYAFTGIIIGFEKLNKIYTDNQKLDIFSAKFNFQLMNILKSLNELYDIDNFYRKNNYEIIRKMTQEFEYYKFIERYSFYKKEEDNIKIIRKSKDILVINIHNKYKLYLNKKITKEYLLNKDKLKIKDKKNSNTVFNSFKYTRIDREKFEYYDEIRLNTALTNIINDIGLDN